MERFQGHMHHLTTWNQTQRFSSEIWMGSLAECLPQLQKRLPGHTFVVITDEHVHKHHPFPIENSHILVMTPGESHKNRRTKESLEDRLRALGLGRETCIIAIGGGVVTDVVGFVAATYCRGVPWVAIPTTLLGMVDASIGGKTGVNTAAGKNLIGAFYPPEVVWIDLSMLATLPAYEMQSGLAEVIKYSLIGSRDLFLALEKSRAKWAARDPDFLRSVIAECATIKSAIVEGDFRETGARRILNFGHTIGHVIEREKTTGSHTAMRLP